MPVSARSRFRFVLCLALALLACGMFFSANPALAWAPPVVILPKAAMSPAQLAVVVNQTDPDSVRVGEYYARWRGVPDANLIRVAFRPGEWRTLDRETFAKLRQQIWDETPPGVQAYFLPWPGVNRVECMSVTSALAFGFDPAWCSDGCQPTRPSPYYNSSSKRPWDELGIRPAMSLPLGWEDAKELIDRAVSADHAWPDGTGYLMETSDPKRNVRSRLFPAIIRRLGALQPLQHRQANKLQNTTDVLFYFTGTRRVRGLDTNRVLPGAAGDNLTSFSGFLSTTGRRRQTSVMDFLLAGFTGSYGTVYEPCNYPQKFSNPGVLMERYLRGESLLEAYWKSVAWPGQGLFVGDPLTDPFGGARVLRQGGSLLVITRSLTKGKYDVWASDDGLPPYTQLAKDRAVAGYPQYILLPDTGAGYLIIQPAGNPE